MAGSARLGEASDVMIQSRGACEKLDGGSHALNILRSWLDGGFDVWTVRATKRKTRELQLQLQRLALGCRTR